MRNIITKKNRMKKFAFTTILSLVIISILILNTYNKDATESNDYSQYSWNNYYSDRYSQASTVSELFDVSDLVIICTVMPDKENIVEYSDISSGAIVPLHGYTLTQLKIKEVVRGDEINEQITIFEEYHIIDNTLMTDEYYQPLRIGNDYILFLTEHPKDGPYAGTYFLSEYTLGKFPLLHSINGNGTVKKSIDSEVDLVNSKDVTIDASIESMSSSDLEFSEKSYIKKYREWYKEVNKELKNIYKKKNN